MDYNTFRYKRFMRDGTAEERVAVLGSPKRIRKGKTEKKKHKPNGLS